MDRLLRSSWPVILNKIARQLNPIHHELFDQFPAMYYWSVYRQRRITRLARIAQAKLECKTGQVGLIRIDRPPEADCQCESFSRRCRVQFTDVG
jgi:hypothetical protein